ncbi:GNAT family N-acetyltransferase [Frankia sp. CNm7]|uniref:GNAT family N-acetyltransferase n=1 Tax=Frankia nepalensis TaxID=1836974 RepID=A0A937RUS1_9ACTN|nr:GNAT family N-acetyltransferase [Frankia nepalensis]MBL7500725.1 GNAT family N-acetyltransferase [Frankia nepalensis]MBL7513209.1 GNAT family N-acetyltransferase [Frankia nepalensis]MBL7518690.1 GNAT family N-acetyltransferase [Frankia nepalensis]MBL7633203.1 GNAT family N-acetyltransferase [Frankia nepalensis]
MIRPAEPEDVPALLRLVRALAEYEREPDAVRMTEADLADGLFGDRPAAAALVATAGDERPGDGSGPVVGFAIWHETFSTWTGRTGAFLVDLFVAVEHRRAGHGRALLARLAALAAERGHRRLEWDVLDWNTPAQAFYRSLGAAPQEGWTTWRLGAEGIAALAATDRPSS